MTLGLATLAGAAIGAVIALLAAPLDQPLFEARAQWTGAEPVAGEWPRDAHTGEEARLETVGVGTRLVVSAPRAPDARSLAAGIVARREADVQGLVRARKGLSLDWRLHLRVAPGADPSPRVECAALLLARARQERDLVAAAPASWATVRTAPVQAPAALLAGRDSLSTAVARCEPAGVLAALVADAKAEDAWFRAGVPDPRAPFAQRAAIWRAWQLSSADSLAALAWTCIHGSEDMLDSSRAARDLALVRLAVRTSPPYEALLASIVPADEPEATPIAKAWGAWIGLGALLGALAAFLAAFVGSALRTARRAGRPLFVPARDPGARDPWLHVVAGPSPAAVARAVIELSAHALARGERVLVVDGGPRLKLHERFEREARWGLMECLVADMPIVGLVQYGGRPGFYLLAHGVAGRREGWAALGRRLDDARPHFGRVVLALDLAAPRAIGESLLGRAMEGWWAEPAEHLPRAGVEFSDRLGIALSGIDLSVIPEVTLEALGGRARALAALQGAAEPVVAEQVPLPEPEPVRLPVPEPVVLDCDLQVRQRLRFLAWMRRVQSERRRVEERPVPPDPVAAPH